MKLLKQFQGEMMIQKELMHKYYFKDISNCPIKEAFDENGYVWDALKKLKGLV